MTAAEYRRARRQLEEQWNTFYNRWLSTHDTAHLHRAIGCVTRLSTLERRKRTRT